MRTFRYPAALRFVPWIGALFMPAMLVLSAVLFVQGELSAPASGLSGALFGAIWIAMIYLILMASARITLTDEELIWERWGKRRAVRLASITRLEHRVTGNALIVHGIEGSIRVEEQLEGYPQFFRALLDRVPEDVLAAEHAALPLECGARILPRCFVEIPFLGAAIGLAYALSVGSWYYACVAAFAVLLLGLAVGTIPRRYRFTQFEIACVSLLRTKRYPTEQLARLDVASVQAGLEHGGQEHRTLVLTFSDGRKLSIPSAMIAYPIHKLEALLGALIR